MSHQITEVDVYTTSTTVPDPGDPVVANDVIMVAQTFGNRWKNLTTGTISLSGSKLFSGLVTFSGALTTVGKLLIGTFLRIATVPGPVAGTTTFDPDDGPAVMIGALTGNTTIALGSTGAVDGSVLFFSQYIASATYTVTFTDGGVITYATFPTNNKGTAIFIFYSGFWRVLLRGDGVT